MRRIRMTAIMGDEIIEEITELLDCERDSTIDEIVEEWAKEQVSFYWEEEDEEDEDDN